MKNKLIELISKLLYAHFHVKSNVPNVNGKVFGAWVDVHGFVDDLIANGVTITQWIPVSERLPVPYETVLVVVREKYDHAKHIGIHTDVGYYRGDREGSIDREWDTFNDWNEGQQLLHITHWMPLTEPPQEEA